MSESDKTAIAAHLYITLRRTANRVIDVDWLAKNDEYAKEVIRLARQQGSDELTHYADLYEEQIIGKPVMEKVAPAPVAAPAKPPMSERAMLLAEAAAEESESDEDEDIGDPSRYIGHLR